MNKLKEELEKIKIEKEVLDTLPINNLKNIKNKHIKLEEVRQEYLNNQENILKEIEKRFNNESLLKRKNDIVKLEKKLVKFEEITNILNNIDTSYEKMGLDKNIHNLKYFYMKDLKLVNENIFDAILKFEKVGIKLNGKDFIHNKYVNEYLNNFFENIKEFDCLNIKENFEKIYWKCPEIITFIELNIRHIFLKNEKQIDKYYEEQKQEILKTDSKIVEKCGYFKCDLISKKILDKDILIDSFLTGELNTKDYTKEKMLQELSKFISKDILEKLDESKLEEVISEMIRLEETLNEYKIYSKYKFIIDNIKEIYEKKQKYKKEYDKLKKDITKKESKILKLNKMGIFNKSEEKNLVLQTALILELKELYEKLDNYKVYYKIETKINENSTIYDLLNLVVSFYDYTFSCINDHYKEIEQDEIKDMIEELKLSINNLSCNIISNIGVSENKNIIYIIKDKYQLSNIIITKEELEDDLENLIISLKKYKVYYSILKNNIDLDKLNEFCEFNKILKK